MKIVIALFVAALVAAPAAAGDGFPQAAVQGGAGVTAPQGRQYVAVGVDQSHTMLTTLQYGGVNGWSSSTARSGSRWSRSPQPAVSRTTDGR